MKNIFKSFFSSMIYSLDRVQGNARAALITQPIWSIVGNLFMPFLTLYMLELGITKSQVGTINAIGMVAGTVIALFAGWVTDRLGRRRTNAFGDLLSWVTACLIWGLSKNVIWFIAAAVAQSFMRLSGVAWNCILSEGTEAKNRVNIFWWFSIVQTITIFVTPIMNLFIGPFGLIASMRWVLIGASAVTTVAIFIRYRMTEELPVGLERMEAAKKESPLYAIKGYLPVLKIIKASPVLLVYILLRTLFFVHIQLKGAFLPITVVLGMGFKNEIIGTLNFVTGAIMLITQLVLMPKLKTLANDRALAISLVIMTLSILILIFAPGQSMFLLILSTVLYAGGSVVTTVLVNTSLANAIPDKERAQVLSMVTIITVAISAPVMWLGGVLSEIPEIGNRLPMVLIALLFAACLALLGIAASKKRRRENKVLKETA